MHIAPMEMRRFSWGFVALVALDHYVILRAQLPSGGVSAPGSHLRLLALAMLMSEALLWAVLWRQVALRKKKVEDLWDARGSTEASIHSGFGMLGTARLPDNSVNVQAPFGEAGVALVSVRLAAEVVPRTPGRRRVRYYQEEP
jgi:hypothetical protein